jgi:hypothetical protein
MIVFGGHDADAPLDTGGRYSPAGGIWYPLPALSAPPPRYGHSAVWDGRQMIVWGGADGFSYYFGGGRYDAAGDSWSPTATLNAPIGRFRHASLWTGDALLIWGGYSFFGPEDSGAQYDPITNRWKATSLANAPSGRFDHSAIWTDGAMVVWGGNDGDLPLRNGGRYDVDPAPDTDHDGHNACAGDCDDASETVWATPGAVDGPRFLADAVTLSWTAPAAAGGTSIKYDTLRSAARSDFVNALCLEIDDPSDTQAEDLAVPLPGGIFYYLVRAENSCPAGAGPVGTDWAGTPRAARPCP